MANEEYLSIGEVSKLCNISQKALRYYEEIGLIETKRTEGNNYRCYHPDSTLLIPVIKYYKQLGFRLEEIRELLNEGQYRIIKRHFKEKLSELKVEQEKINRKFTSVKDWYDLILEAETIIDNNICDVAVKYFEERDYLFQEQIFLGNVKDSIINIKFTNFVESIANEITGPVIIHFSSIDKRRKNQEQKIEILQKTLLDYPEKNKKVIGGYPMLSCYHIGSHDTIDETYNKMFDWAIQHGYKLQQDSYERYITDYWTNNKNRTYVTEIMVNVSR